MALTKYKLGDLIELSDERNFELQYGIDDVKGISIQKIFIETKADMTGVSLKPYILVKPDSFAYVTVTSRNSEKITIAHNDSSNTYIASSSYVVFRVKKKDLLLSNYLFMYFNRPEFDRYVRFNSWGSAREIFNWEDMCDIDIDMPPLPVQQKYVDVYKSMLANQRSYERGLEDLKLVCDGYIEELRRKIPCEKIGKYIDQSDANNIESEYDEESVAGISTQKQIITTKADLSGVSLSSYKIFAPGQFAYVPDTSRRGDKVSLAYNATEETYLVSSITVVFSVTDSEHLLPDYLSMYFNRPEFDRYARFNSWGSARETFDWSEMCDVQIPIPDVKTQKAIADIYKVYIMRKNINEQLKAQIRDICPILIRGALEDGG